MRELFEGRDVVLMEAVIVERGRQMLAVNRDYAVEILGGCCGTGRAHLRALVRGLLGDKGGTT